MTQIIKFKFPEVRAAYVLMKPIQFRYPSGDWFDYDYSTMEPPSFDVPILLWRVTPPVLHPIFNQVLEQFNSQFGGF
jgi:hypothetical protein